MIWGFFFSWQNIGGKKKKTKTKENMSTLLTKHDHRPSRNGKFHFYDQDETNVGKSG